MSTVSTNPIKDACKVSTKFYNELTEKDQYERFAMYDKACKMIHSNWMTKEELSEHLREKEANRLERKDDRLYESYLKKLFAIESDEDFIRATWTTLMEDSHYDGSEYSGIWEDDSCKRIINCSYMLDDEISDDEEEIVKNIEWFDIGKIYEGIWALHNRSELSSSKLLTWLDNVKTEDFKRVLLENNIIILSNNENKLHVMVGKKPVTKKDISTSMFHLRDAICICQKYLQQTMYGSLASWIYYSRMSYVKSNSKPRLVNDKGRVTVKEFKAMWTEIDHVHKQVLGNDSSSTSYVELVLESRKKFDTNKVILGHLCHEIAAELLGTDDDNPSDEQIEELVAHINGVEEVEETEE